MKESEKFTEDFMRTSNELTMKEQVYEFLKTIPKGKVVTYSQIANFLGNKNLCRIVGNILHNNPDPIKYPCYKVVNNKGELSRNFGDGGIEVQKKRLIADGIEVVDYKVDLEKYRYCFELSKKHKDNSFVNKEE